MIFFLPLGTSSRHTANMFYFSLQWLHFVLEIFHPFAPKAESEMSASIQQFILASDLEKKRGGETKPSQKVSELPL